MSVSASLLKMYYQIKTLKTSFGNILHTELASLNIVTLRDLPNTSIITTEP